MSKLLWTIFATALLAGIFLGVWLKTGIDPDPQSQLIDAGKLFCKSVPDNPASSSCSSNMALLGLVAILGGILEIVGLISQARDWRLGVGIYVGGFILGAILVLAS